MTTSSPDPDNLLDGIDITDIYVPADAIELAQRSILASQITPPDVAAPAEAVVRLSGEGVRRNRIGVRQASRIIGGLQEVLAAIGQALVGNPTARGQIPALIRARTALNLFPAAAAGSVQIRLEAPIVSMTSQLGGLEDRVDNLASDAASTLVQLMDEVASTEFDDSVVVQHLQRLGPRVARQVQLLASELVVDDVDLDLTWRRFAEAPEVGRLPHDRARLLRDIIRRNRVESQIITLVGTLVTISTVRPAAIVLDSGRIVTLSVDGGMAAGLREFFTQRVAAQVEEVVTHEDASGRERVQYQLVNVELATSHQEGDEATLDGPAE